MARLLLRRFHDRTFTRHRRLLIDPLEDRQLFALAEYSLSASSELAAAAAVESLPTLVGAVTSTSAKISFRTDQAASVAISYAANPTLAGASTTAAILTSATSDFTGIAALSGLLPETTYYYRLLIDGQPQGNQPFRSFTTFADGSVAREFTFAITADVLNAAQNPTAPAPAYAAAAAEDPRFLLQLGDFDHRNPKSLDSMRRMHRDMRGTNTGHGTDFSTHFTSSVPVFHVWDDHDYGKNNGDKTFIERPAALQAFKEYYPTPTLPNPSGIWHSLRYGQVEVFMLDLRSQRDPGIDPDGPNKSMLDGDNIANGQKAWLKAGLLQSTATWKVIASSVPFNTTTKLNDGWAAFQTERQEILSFIDANNIDGVVVVSGDLHTGGAIDSGVHSGLVELSVPHTNLISDTHASSEPGTWDVGFTSGIDGAGYGLIRVETAPDQLIIEAHAADGALRQQYVVSLTSEPPPPPVAALNGFISTATGGNLTLSNGSTIAVQGADIASVTIDAAGQRTFARHFDGGDVGLTKTSENVDAFTILADGSLVISTTGAYSVSTNYSQPNSGSGPRLSGGGEDLLRFVPAGLGANTKGTWSLYLDGSQIGLGGVGIDAVAVLDDGRILLSPTAALSVPGVSARDEDVVGYNPALDRWTMYFDGSDVGLSDASEGVDALAVKQDGTNRELFLSTRGAFSVPGLSGDGNDLIRFAVTSLGGSTEGNFSSAINGGTQGIGKLGMDGFALASAQSAAAATLSGGLLATTSRQSGSTQPMEPSLPEVSGPRSKRLRAVDAVFGVVGMDDAGDVRVESTHRNNARRRR